MAGAPFASSRSGLDGVLGGFRRLDVGLGLVPAPAQGAICIEARSDNNAMRKLLEPVNHADTFAAVSCERAFLEVLDGSCRAPIAGYALVEGDHIRFSGMILTPDGQTHHSIVSDGHRSDAVEIGHKAGQAVRDDAGPGFFEGWS